MDGVEGCECHSTYSETLGAPMCTAMGGCETCNVVTPRYNGRKNRLNIPDIPSNYGCDGANSTYTPHCDQWYFISHCLDLENGALDLSAYDNATKDMINAEISAGTCSGHLGLAAYKAYAADTTWTRAPTPQPTNFPTPAPTPEPTVRNARESRSGLRYPPGNPRVC